LIVSARSAYVGNTDGVIIHGLSGEELKEVNLIWLAAVACVLVAESSLKIILLKGV
jgi:hypothetical protein